MLHGSKAEMADIETPPSLPARADPIEISTCFSGLAISAVGLTWTEGECTSPWQKCCAHSLGLQLRNMENRPW